MGACGIEWPGMTLTLLRSQRFLPQRKDGVLQLVYGEWFGEVVIDAERVGLFDVLCLRRRGEDDDLDVLFVGEGKLAQGGNKVEAVDERHVQVQQDDVRCRGCAFADLSEEIEGSTAIVNSVDFVEKSAGLRYTDVDVTTDLVVVND